MRRKVALTRPVVRNEVVVIVSGSSGSGKTDLAITAPHDDPATQLVIVNVVALHLPQDFDPSTCEGDDDAVKVARNKSTESVILHAIDECLKRCCDHTAAPRR